MDGEFAIQNWLLQENG